jgi:Na+-transporting NADH:ubiquinone oxidoreductase subunit NqrA
MSRVGSDTRLKVLALVLQGEAVSDIAETLKIRRGTVEAYLSEFRKRPFSINGSPVPVPPSLYSCALDASPLLELVQRRVQEMQDEVNAGLEVLCELRNLEARTIRRIKATGKVSYLQADEICCRLGVPTACIYPFEQLSLEVSA